MPKPAHSLLFMHIPKTTGSSINAYLESHFLPKEILLHIENIVLVKPRNKITELAGKRLLTAHLKYDTLADLLEIKKYFTMAMLREPLRQTLSHLAWLNRLGYPEQKEEFANHPDYIKQIVERMHQTDISTFLATLNHKEKNLLDNCQTRYFLPFHGEVKLNQQHFQKAVRNLSSFDLVGLQENFNNSLMLLAFHMNWAPPKKTPRLNTSNKKYFSDLADADRNIKKVLDNITRFDQQLHAVAQQLFKKQQQAVFDSLKANSSILPAGANNKEPSWEVLESWLKQNNRVDHFLLTQRFISRYKDKIARAFSLRKT